MQLVEVHELKCQGIPEMTVSVAHCTLPHAGRRRHHSGSAGREPGIQPPAAGEVAQPDECSALCERPAGVKLAQGVSPCLTFLYSHCW